MPKVTSLAVTPRCCAIAPAATSDNAPVTARPIPFVDLPIVSSLYCCGTITPSTRLDIHAVDHALVLLVHELALEFHGRRQFVVLGGELLLDQPELLDGLDPREVLVDPLDLRPDQVGDFAGSAERGEVGEGHIV